MEIDQQGNGPSQNIRSNGGKFDQRLAIDSFYQSKIRFMLTALGMVIGTASLILVVTIGMTGKQYILNHRDEPGAQKSFELCFGKRPAEELYDLSEDPWQVTNLAADPRYSEKKARLRAELDRYLTRTKDPRATDQGAEFDRFYYVSSGVSTKPVETRP